jgi:alpha-beta hydrolase superfamily lysophospholipase
VKILFIIVICVAGLFLLGVAAALVAVATREPKMPPPTDMLDFAALRHVAPEIGPPTLRRYPARDGEQLAYRLYESKSDRILIFIHGSSYHGGGYNALAAALSIGGAAKVVLPNLRGHYMSGRRRGDVDYIGQYEDDLDDLIGYLRAQHLGGPITLGGHSSGGGLTIRFAGGRYAHEVSSFLLLAPIVPRSDAVRGGTAGGWAILNMRRLYGLLALNAVGIRGFNGLPIIAFNKPPEFWDGTETLTYSYRLNASYHPRFNYDADIRALGAQTMVLVGARDQAVDADALRKLISADAPQAVMEVMPDIGHFGIFYQPAALAKITSWMRSLPEHVKP